MKKYMLILPLLATLTLAACGGGEKTKAPLFCENCSGVGKFPCQICNGLGGGYDPYGNFKLCPACGGTCEVPCPVCNGTGLK